MPSKHSLYDAAVAEVRNEATPEQIAALEVDITQWREALQSVIDEVDGQFDSRYERFRDETDGIREGSGRYAILEEEFDKWKHGARTFKKHISVRLRAVDRMCETRAEELGVSAPLLEDLLEVVRRACALVDTDRDGYSDPEAFDEAVDVLTRAVDNYRDRLAREEG